RDGSDPSRVSSIRQNVKAYVSFKKGDVLRYQTYRSGYPDREVIYRVIAEPAPNVFTVSVSPGDRTFTWIIDEKKNAFIQQFQLPNPQTGALTESETHPRLSLPL